MRALRFHGRGDVRIDTLPAHEPGPGDVLVQVHGCGICGSDLHEYRHGPHAVPSAHPHPLTGEVAPIILGHEFAGIVTALGPGVSAQLLGARVVVEPLLRDGTCAQCRAGMVNRCRQVGFMGLSGGPGGLAETATVPVSSLHRVPDNVTLDQAALTEPLAVAWHAIDQAALAPGEDVLILGAGPLGIATLLCLRHRGAGRIILSEPSPQRRALATALGADQTLDPATDQISRRARGVQIAIDCSGHPGAMDDGLAALQPGGRMVIAALHPGTGLIPTSRLLHLELSLIGSIGYPDTFPAVLAAFAEGLDPTPMISRRTTLADAPATFEALAQGLLTDCKVLVAP